MGEEDSEKPRLRLASNNSPEDVRRGWAAQRIEYPLQQLSANILRVVRGAGKPDHVVDHCIKVVTTFQEYFEAFGYWPSSDVVSNALAIRQPAPEKYDEHWEWERQQERMVQGALQIAASRLVGQLTQEHRGDFELMQGFYGLERVRADRQKRHQEEEKERRRAERERQSATRKPRAKAKRSPKPKRASD